MTMDPQGLKADHRGMNDDEFQARVQEAMKAGVNKSGEDGFKMTEEEADRIQKCFKEPEFRELFHEYLDEMSDPKNREEMDTYIRQLGNEGQVPEGMSIPDEGLCAKGWQKNAQTRDG